MRRLFVPLQRLRNLFRPQAVWYEGRYLPARHLRFGGTHFRTEAQFLASARAEADRLIRHCGLQRLSRVLDVGCGVGRLAIGISDRVGEIARYCGVDVHAGAIRWCENYLAPAHPSGTFMHLDLANPRYNPTGRPLNEHFRFPFGDQSFDIIYLYSVFSHMMVRDVCAYLQEFRRLLAANGIVFLTAFVESGVPGVTVNPPGYRRVWQGTLHCVRYEQQFFEGLVTAVGLKVHRFDYGQETDGQSAYYLTCA
ncbi:methyltransferase domain-containing protein [Candidatus Parcubacteria bacterium]|nr:methyltransferase domain-containing protein [Candidatus Parcubacteria bacterium]